MLTSARESERHFYAQTMPRYVIDAPTLLHVIDNDLSLDPEHQLVAPNWLRCNRCSAPNSRTALTFTCRSCREGPCDLGLRGNSCMIAGRETPDPRRRGAMLDVVERLLSGACVATGPRSLWVGAACDFNY